MFRFAAIFSDNMVLQREKNIELWGECDGEDGITVSALQFGVSTKAVISGRSWRAILPPQNACEGITIRAEGSSGEIITFSNVAVGEVWLLGGQSNMELEIRNAKGGRELLRTLTPECGVRYYYTPKQSMLSEKLYEAERSSGWSMAGEESSQAWSAVGLYFGLKLQRELGVTVGLIGCNWGGTSGSCWVGREALCDDRDTRTYVDEYDEAVKGKTEEQMLSEYAEFTEYDRQWNEKSAAYCREHPDVGWEELQAAIGKNLWPGPMCPSNPTRPYGLYEAMVMRICPYTLRGFTYYQGESDEHKPKTYYKLLSRLIGEWRSAWGDDRLPFLIVQLPMFRYIHEEDNGRWAYIREAQDKAFRTIKNTGLAVILDKGEIDNIHPTDKKDVGERLALQAEKTVYGMDCDAFGPMYKGFICRDGGMEILFEHAEKGFTFRGDAVGFELAGADGIFHPADAKAKGSRIFLSSGSVEAPLYARYNFVNYGEVNVFGSNGIPLAPFRTCANDDLAGR